MRATASGKTQQKIDSERNQNVQENRKLLQYFGLGQEDFPAARTAENVAILDDHIEGFLSEKWQAWVAACQDLETNTGISLAKNQLAYRTATLRAEGEVPEMLLQILAKAKGE
ncbi:hypothetical protein [Xanthomonas hortorum]|uniref:hypothetical protein n=1 Tax=Xanthomonas hortorum TaxID=56454 RepID=UPI001F3124F8|nr:hypothetical protein [Xanthomonas hortorum]MCE4365074.1 hypothetical protein [Xanthomonas hortorum]